MLPEYHLTGWVPSDPKFAKLALEWESYLKKYQALAKELSINIVPGTIVQNDGSNLTNKAYFITSAGEIAGTYQKKNLWHPERPHLTSSAHNPHDVIETPLGKVGLLICWDLAFPEAFRSLIMQGAKIIIVPTFWMLSDCSESGLKRNPMAESLFLNTTLTARAYENTCAIVFVNAGGTREENAAGLSQVAMPFIGPVEGSFRDGEEAEAMRLGEMDMEILNEAEDNDKVRQDLAREDGHDGYEKATA